MNTAVGDSFDIGWKVAAVLKGYAGSTLLASYEAERRPVAVRNMDQSGKHWSMHLVWQEWVRQSRSDICSQPRKATRSVSGSKSICKRTISRTRTSELNWTTDTHALP